MKNFLFLVFLLVVTGVCSAETIKLKSGKVVEGKIVEQTADYIKIDTGIGANLTYYKDDIEKIGSSSQGEPQNDVTMVTATLNHPDIPEVPAMSGEEADINKILKFNDRLQDFAEELKKTQIKQTYFQNQKEVGERITDTEDKLLSQKGRIPDGIIKEYDENGQLKSEVMFRNNNPIGPWKSYDDTGALDQIYNYENGERNGEYKAFYKNGSIKKQGMFAQGKPTGVAKIFDENGKVKAEVDYRDRNYDSIARAYNEDGSWVEMYIKDGKSAGIKVFDNKGNIIRGQK